MKSLEVALRTLRDTGRKALVPYFVAGATNEWTRHVEAAAMGGADVIEIGIPFSDPMMDGIVIQEAGLRALERGTTFESVCHEIASISVDIPLVAMTYYNIFLHHGLERSAGRLSACGVSGAIVVDLSLEEAGEWLDACEASDVANILLVAPSTPAPRASLLARQTQGFAYAAARMAVTGAARDEGVGITVVERVREASDVPVYVGIGVTTPAQGARAAAMSDGVIVGSALVKVVLDGGTTSDVEAFVRSFRLAIDRGVDS